MATGLPVQLDEGVPEAAGGGQAAAALATGRATRKLRLTAVECEHSIYADAIARTDSGLDAELLYLSCAAPQNTVKALRAVLYSPKMNFDLQVEWDGIYQGTINQGQKFDRGLHGYDCFSHNLGYNTYHLVAVGRRPGFMTTLDDEAVYQQLCDPRYTTPVLREWAPYIREQMLKSEKIVRAKCYGCACAYMVATDQDLDTIVERGLKSRKLRIE